MKKIFIFFAALFFSGAAYAELAPKPPTKGQEAAGRANAVAFKFNARAQETAGNIFFSPYSMYCAFAMLYEGARNKTAEEMRGVFDFYADSAAARGEISLLRREMRKATKGSEFRQANSVWYQFGFSFLPEYEAALKLYYGASAETANFRTAPAKAANDINSWVRKKTGGKITGLFDSSSINQLTRLVLANAVYFKGKWTVPFKAENTSEQDFTLAGGEKVKVQMMDSAGPMKAGYYEDADLQAVGLNYLGGTLRMLVLLPREGKSAVDAGKALTPELLAAVREGLGRDKVIVSLPKFKFSSFWALNTALSGMGMPQAFSQGADFSGMDGTTTFYVQAAAQKAFVEVNEEGTEAAAATGISAVRSSARPSRAKVFRADRPFLFLIEDSRTGLILFLGRIDDPRQGD